MSQYIFFTGGVTSSLGKGVSIASLATLLKASGLNIRVCKLDPYLNIDPGTMSPLQHGEVFVTDDGAETDLDVGHYERFANINASRDDSATSGSIYNKLMEKERNGEFLGGTVQIVPHFTDAIEDFITSKSSDDIDFVMVEIGGTVGDIESLPFYTALSRLSFHVGKSNCMFVHVTLLPYIKAAEELKTKATQHSVSALGNTGIHPDFLICRSDIAINNELIDKLSRFCNISSARIIPALDVDMIYKLPISYQNSNFCKETFKYFNIPYQEPDLSQWQNFITKYENASKKIKIGIFGKYTTCKDAYKSISEALLHASSVNDCRTEIEWFNTKANDKFRIDKDIDGIIVPGGFGVSGTSTMIAAIEQARTERIPFFGICLGMQLAVIEYARNVMHMAEANSTEFAKTPQAVVNTMNGWMDNNGETKKGNYKTIGGTMRLGAYKAILKEGSLMHQIYGDTQISERHRHRYEINSKYLDKLEDGNIVFSGKSIDGVLVECLEIRDHPFFIGVQFHPELKSKPLAPAPTFVHFIKAVLDRKGRK